MKYTVTIDNGEVLKSLNEEQIKELFPNYVNLDFFKQPFEEHILIMPDKQVTIKKE